MPPIVTEDLLEHELQAVVRAGGYPTEKAAVGHALTVLLSANDSLRVDTAVELYREGHVTLSRAAEIADLDRDTFKEKLTERGVRVTVDEAPDEIRAGADLIRQLRSG